MRRLVYLLLLFCLPLYGFALQGGQPHAYGAESFTHEVEHEQGLQHHHEDDGSIHYDESDKSLAHAQDHSSSAQPFGFHVPSLTAPAERQVSVLAPFIVHAPPDPFLDGPRKPPRPAPGLAAGGLPHA